MSHPCLKDGRSFGRSATDGSDAAAAGIFKFSPASVAGLLATVCAAAPPLLEGHGEELRQSSIIWQYSELAILVLVCMRNPVLGLDCMLRAWVPFA